MKKLGLTQRHDGHAEFFLVVMLFLLCIIAGMLLSVSDSLGRYLVLFYLPAAVIFGVGVLFASFRGGDADSNSELENLGGFLGAWLGLITIALLTKRGFRPLENPWLFYSAPVQAFFSNKYILKIAIQIYLVFANRFFPGNPEAQPRNRGLAPACRSVDQYQGTVKNGEGQATPESAITKIDEFQRVACPAFGHGEAAKAKREAEFFRIALFGELVKTDMVIAWADELLATGEVDTPLLADIALAASKPVHVVESLLAQMPEECDFTIPLYATLAYCGWLLEIGKIPYRPLLRKLEEISHIKQFPQVHYDEIAWIAEEEYLYGQDEKEELQQYLLNYLHQFKEFKAFLPGQCYNPTTYSKTIYTLDGNRITTIDEFYDEITRIIFPELDWGRNLDALNDILNGGFGTPAEGFIIVWKNSQYSKKQMDNKTFDTLTSIINDHKPGDNYDKDTVELRLE